MQFKLIAGHKVRLKEREKVSLKRGERGDSKWKSEMNKVEYECGMST